MKPASALPASELDFIRQAAQFLENPNLLIRMVNRVGKPIENIQKHLPEKAHGMITEASRSALNAALKTALTTIQDKTPAIQTFTISAEEASRTGRLHLFATAATGAVGGAFGLASLPLELPVTTCIMMRSIAQIASRFGADLNDPEAQLQCLYVFSLGSPSAKDDATETGYYASRLGFAHLMREAASYLAAHSFKRAILGYHSKGFAPPLVRFITSLAARFEIVVTQKTMAELLPLIGAAGGALINGAFTGYFNDAAHYHFGLRRLELTYGQETIQKLYSEASRTSAT